MKPAAEIPLFEPWIGRNSNQTKLLILSESTYSWRENGKIQHPPPSHPTNTVLHAIANDPKRGYFASMNKVLTGCHTSTPEKRQRAWDDYTYTVYVHGTVGKGARKRPCAAQWKAAGPYFLAFIEERRPARVIITGWEMWNSRMPYTANQRNDHLQAYKLNDGSLVWCLGLPHPSNSTHGFQWQQIRERILGFIEMELPLT